MKNHVLIIESDDGIIELLECRLDLLKVSYSVAKSAKEARVHLKKHRPSWVILSLKLPDQNGLSLIQKIKKMPFHPPRVIVYSMQDDPNTTQLAYALGADEFVSKMEPVSYLFEVVLQSSVG